MCSILRRVSSAKAIVGTIITTLSGLRIAINASIIKLLPKLVGALIAIFSPAKSLLRTFDCALWKVTGTSSPTLTLNASTTTWSSHKAVFLSI